MALHPHSSVTYQYETCHSKRTRNGGFIKYYFDGVKKRDRIVLNVDWNWKEKANILCEKLIPSEPFTKYAQINGTDRKPRQGAFVKCPLGHYTHQFLACDAKSSCWSRDYSSHCDSPMKPLPPAFYCTNGIEHLPYTLVCDHHDDCVDHSDEDFCDVPPCPNEHFTCNNKQCVPPEKVCDNIGDCRNSEDEEQCPQRYSSFYGIPSPALVSLSAGGMLAVFHLEKQKDEMCPPTHFQCLDDGDCLPLFLRCNGVHDCPGREDERGCDACPGFYRCRNSEVCLHDSDVCDGHAHCPQHDDELMCRTTCPPACLCWGLAFYCRRNFTVSSYPHLRYLDATGSNMTPDFLTNNSLLIHLTLAKCNLLSLVGLVLPNLLILDIHDNQLNTMCSIKLDGVPQLRELSVAGNPLSSVLEGIGVRPHILKLDLSRVLMRVFNVTDLSVFPKLQVLNLSHSGVQRVQGEIFKTAHQLRVIDLRGCSMTRFPRDVFKDLHYLQIVHTSNFKVCCSAVLPVHFNLPNCFAPSDAISSCENLLRRKEYSMCVLFLSVLAIAGNITSFMFRRFASARENGTGCHSLVTHLSMSDFVMGVYLAIIGITDRVYHGTYLWNDESWRHSVVCKLSGFLSFLSSEVSALIICLITIDRVLVLRFSLSRLSFSSVSAHVSSVFVWVGCGLAALIPALPVKSHWEFYNQNGLCIPLPVTTARFPGHVYSFSILVVFNLVVFVFICVGQLIVSSVSASTTTRNKNDHDLARRLVPVAMTNVLCWIPACTLGLFIANSFTVPDELKAGVAIFVLPLNSAINPWIYTFSVIMERQRHGREEKLRAILLAQLKGHS